MRFSFLCTCLLALVTSAPAQETFAPLITENTALFSHVDLRNADVDTFKQNWVKYSEGLMKALHFEASSLRSTLSALNNDLEKLDAVLRPAIETITQKLEIQEIALIVDTEMLEDSPFFLAVPWKDKTDGDLETLLSLFPDEFLGGSGAKDEVITAGDFLFLVADLDEDAFKEWFENLNPCQDALILQAMNILGNDEIKIAVAMTDSIREYLLDTLREEAEDIPDAVINIFGYIARKVDWAAMSLPNPLTNPEVMENMPPMKLTVKTRTAPDARMLRNMLETSIDLAITAWRTAVFAMKASNEDMPETPQFFYEFAKGYLRTLLPTVENDKLIFKAPDFGGRFWEFYTVTYGGAIYHVISLFSAWESAFDEDDE
jgi:hypothetical protein